MKGNVSVCVGECAVVIFLFPGCQKKTHIWNLTDWNACHFRIYWPRGAAVAVRAAPTHARTNLVILLYRFILFAHFFHPSILICAMALTSEPL